MRRNDFLSSLIGEPWSWQSRNCWDFAVHVERQLFDRALPHISVPDGFSRRWVMDEFGGHPERTRWREVAQGPGGLVLAADGALVLMAHVKFPAHIGVWLRPEQRIIHCDGKTGVACETPLAMRQMGWKQLTFFEPND
ncbi:MULTISPECIES: hypothetical protein [unclassified Bradyrhizobium]|uniref:hypothetical protein n=1 Tax=unclassified Bradyrhizobium TaxID=2631580 RepID=UPI00291679CE|nr:MULTISPECIES: hypothetical protein [unclassified Bradyrhizobium]